MTPFFTQERATHGVWIRAHAVVDPAALDEAARRIARLLAGCPGVIANLAAAGAELQIVGRDQRVTDLPQHRHLAGRVIADGQTLDERARGYGGLCATVSEEMLLRLPTARHADHRDIVAHELAHTVLDFGLGDAARERIVAAYRASVGRWGGAYAATNEHEWFAECAMWWVGSRGDHGALAAPPADGRDGLAAFDPAGFAAVDAVWTGRRPAGSPRFTLLAARSEVRRSARTGAATVVWFRNHGQTAARRWWLDSAGREVDYGEIGPHGAQSQPTYAGHAWVVDGPGGRQGPFVATARRGLVAIGAG